MRKKIKALHVFEFNDSLIVFDNTSIFIQFWFNIKVKKLEI